MTRLDADWLRSTEAQSAAALLERAGHKALFVGGCVRNSLLGAPVADLDLATDARPDKVLSLARATGMRAVPNGIDHGTVTLLPDEAPVEVTTFRRDVATDGRHATVAFTDDVAADASRRDFTMNALYCDARGLVVDPLDGLSDLHQRRLRFIGRAEDRVREDYLRILRFFRFHAWYADPAGGIDQDGLAACASLSDGLHHVSPERIGAELRKLLAAPDPAPSMAAMQASGVLTSILPGADAEALAPLVTFERSDGIDPDPMARLAAIGGEGVAARLRLSRAEARKLTNLAAAARDTDGPAVLGYRLGAIDGATALRLRHALMGTPLDPSATMDIARGATATFPVTAKDLMPDFEGPALGARLRELETRWRESGLTLTREDLLS